MDRIKSKALEDNLAVTKIDKIELPEKYQWLLLQSSSFYGIHQKTKEFINELFHPYANPEHIIISLKNNIFNSLWLYYKIDETEKALLILLEIFSTIMNLTRSSRLSRKLVNEFLTFLNMISDHNDTPHSVSDYATLILKEWLDNYEEHFIYYSGQSRNVLSKLNSNELLDTDTTFKIIKRLLKKNLELWRRKTHFEEWFQKHLFKRNYDANQFFSFLGKKFFDDNINNLDNCLSLKELYDIPSYNEIVNHHREFLTHFSTLSDKIHYIFYLFSIEEMLDLSDHLLWDLNRLLANLKKDLNKTEILNLIEKVFSNLRDFRSTHPSMILDCILTIGNALISPENSELNTKCIELIIYNGFIAPGKLTLTKDWQLSVDKNHIKNIRVWLNLISRNPEICEDLLAALTVNLVHKGVFISDTDLFQKDVSNFLNSDIKNIYVQSKQLLRLFPVFFNEIGAEGEIREISTAIDELFQRKDRLVHFLRKQIHTESNNTHVHLVRQIFNYWLTLNTSKLKNIIPDDVMHFISQDNHDTCKQQEELKKFLNQHGLKIDEILKLSWQTVEKLFEKAKIKENSYLYRIYLLFQIYYLLMDKYELDPYDILKFLYKYNFFNKREQLKFKQALSRKDYDSLIRQLLSYMSLLNSTILDPEPSQSWENIYFKRHIAAGIPSMYGQYHEPKLEAIGMTFRLENIIKRLIIKNIEQLNLNYINAKTLNRTLRILDLFEIGLKQEGIKNEAFTSALEMLRTSQKLISLTIDQYLDIFKLIKDSINEIINDYYYRFYDNGLRLTADNLKNESITNISTVSQKFAEEFYRKLLSSSFLVQELDNFISQILISLSGTKALFRDIDINKVLAYDPDLIIFNLYTKNSRVDSQILLGSKAFFLKKMYQYSFPIPPGFVITTELYRKKQVVYTHPDIMKEFEEILKNNIKLIENSTGKEFGCKHNPLLISVRSGAPMSLPGAMNTFLNIGLNNEITEKLSKKKNYRWTAWDCYRRLLQSWGMAYGINRDSFDQIMISYKRKHNIKLKTQFSPSQMQEMAFEYKQLLESKSVKFEQDPFKQLKLAISHVLDSWNTDLAQLYRQKLDIADEWGTAVIIQQMILGNISQESGTGVVFTYADWSEKPGIHLNGDFTLCSQGEDVVAGLVHTLPISEDQRKHTDYNLNISLEKDFPEIYKKLYRLAKQLTEEKKYPHQEIEFTFEGTHDNSLYILQTRNQVIQKSKQYWVFNVDKKELNPIGTGIGVGKGVLNGIVVFSRSDIEKYKSCQIDLILVRPDTVPDDMDLLFDCQGLLTARGGVTSHAAVTATRLGITGIVNCRMLKVYENDSCCKIGDYSLKPGDSISLDSNNGSIYLGHYKTEKISALKL